MRKWSGGWVAKTQVVGYAGLLREHLPKNTLYILAHGLEGRITERDRKALT